MESFRKLPVAEVRDMLAMHVGVYSVYLLYWYKSTQFTCFSGTKVRLLTQLAMSVGEDAAMRAVL